MGAGGSVVVPFKQRNGIRGEDKYAATTFRRVDLREEELNKLYTVYLKIKEKNRYPKRVDPSSICAYFGLTGLDFIVKLFDAVDFDANDSINFKEFTLGLWNFLTLAKDRLPALLFYVYDTLDCDLLDEEDLKAMLEATHRVKMSPLTLSLNNVMKCVLINNTLKGVDCSKFKTMCINSPFLIKPIEDLQKKMRKKVLGTEFWHKLELRRTASVRSDARDVNYAYVVNEETEVWRKKDYDMGIATDYELDEHEIANKEALERKKREAEAKTIANTIRVEEELQAQKARDEKVSSQREEERLAKLEEEMDALFAENKDELKDDTNFVGKHRSRMSTVEGRSTSVKTGILKDFESFAESLFVTASGEFVAPSVLIDAVTVYELPGEEKFILGIITDSKKKEEKLVMVNQDLARRRLRGADIARINRNFKFVGSSRLTVKSLPAQIKLRNNTDLVALCNNESLIPDYLHKSNYCSGEWNKELRSLVMKSVTSGESNYRQMLVDFRETKSKSFKGLNHTEGTQDDRVKCRLDKMMTQRRRDDGKKSTRRTICSDSGKDLRNISTVRDGRVSTRQTVIAPGSDKQQGEPLKRSPGKVHRVPPLKLPSKLQ